MTIFRDAEAALAAEWLAAMDDTCTVRTNAAGQGTYNPATRTYDGTPSTVYAGVCLVRPRGHTSTDRAEAQHEVVDYDVYLPPTATGLAPDQQLTVDTTASATAPADLVGAVLTVMEIGLDTYNARIRLGCTLDRGTG